MKTVTALGVASLALVTSSLIISAAPTTDEAYKDIKATFGFVPTFLKGVPDEVLGPAWEELKALELGTETALSSKAKELIALGVSAQIPCRYCIYADTEFAKAAGATEREIKEAVGMAAITRHWSTVLNGMQVDEVAFDRDSAKVFTYLAKNKGAPAKSVPVTDAASAFNDIEMTLGTVPGFFATFPAAAIAPAWREMKGLQLNPQTALDGKTKELIGLAVAAQIPCHYCVRFHTSAAKLHGANQQEIQEAVAMAAITRHWSTVIQGTQQDETKLKREVAQIVRKMRKETEKMPKAATR